MNHIEKRGIDIFYRIGGVDNASPIIFVHGLAGDSRFFHNQLKYFSQFYKTIAIDLPGHGKSPFVIRQSISLYNKSIDAVIKREKIDKYILAGHSMGGVICIENYLRNKDRVKALLLISTSATLPIDELMIKESISNFDLFFHKMLSSTFNKKSGIFIRAARQKIDDHEKKMIIGDLKICAKINYHDKLNEIEVPVLIIANRRDKMVPVSRTVEMHKKIKKSKIVLFDYEGHMPFFENSAEFNSAISRFIGSIQ